VPHIDPVFAGVQNATVRARFGPFFHSGERKILVHRVQFHARKIVHFSDATEYMNKQPFYSLFAE
jgi:hypothetical protein